MHSAPRSEKPGAGAPRRVRQLRVRAPAPPSAAPQRAAPASERSVESAAIVVPISARPVRPAGRGSQPAQQVALLLHLQRTEGNHAVHRYLEHARLIALSPGPGDRPIQRLELSDLNPLEAAKRLAERVFGTIRDLGGRAWESAKSLGSAAWEKVKGAGAGAWESAKQMGTGLWETVRSAGSGAWSTVKSFGSSAVDTVRGIGNSAWQAASALGTKAWNGAKGLASNAWDFAKRTGMSAWNGAKQMGGALVGKAKSLGTGLWNTVKSTAGKVWGQAQDMGRRAWTGVKGLAGKAYGAAKTWGGKAVDAAKAMAGKATTENLCKAVGWLAGKAYDLVAPLVKGAWNKAKEWGGAAWNAAKLWGGKLWDGAKSWAGKVGDFAKSAAAKAYASIRDGAARAWQSAKDLGNKVITGATQAAGKAWDFAKKLGGSAWDFAKTKAADVYGKAKAFGEQAWAKATSLGTAVWGRAQEVGGRIADAAKSLGSKVLGLADTLTGGAASKVASLAQDILGKASGLLAWVVSKAQDLARKALDTAKAWAEKAFSAARDAAAKAFAAARDAASRAVTAAKEWGAKALTTAKDWAGRALTQAKDWGSKAIATAKGWADKAWSTAKDLGGKAIGAAKELAGKAWDAAKDLGGQAWTAIKDAGGKARDFAKTWGGKAWGLAKTVGGKLSAVAKSLGLDKAMGTVKALSRQALKWVDDARASVLKRVVAAVSLAKQVGPYLAGLLVGASPIGMSLAAIDAACRFVACVFGAKDFSLAKLVDQVTKAVPFVRAVRAAVADPQAAMMPLVAPIVTRLEAQMPGKAAQIGRERLAAAQSGAAARAQPAGMTTASRASVAVARSPSSAGPTTLRSTASSKEIIDGLGRHLSAKWAALNVWQMVKDMLWSLVWPWPAIGHELSGIGADVKTAVGSLFAIRSVTSDPLGALHDLWTNLSHLLDIPLALWRHLNSIAMLLMGWVTIALVILGAVGGTAAGGVIGGILAALPSAGVAAPAGAGAGAGAGGFAGAGAGFAAAMGIGEVLLFSYVAAETISIAKAFVDLASAEQTSEEKERDYSQVADSLLGLGTTAVLMFIGWIGSKLAAAFVEFVRGIRAPKAEPIKPAEVDPLKSDPAEAGGERTLTPAELKAKLREHVRTQDGRHETFFDEEGAPSICSANCDIMRRRYRDVLADRPDLRGRITRIENMPEGTLKEVEAKKLARERMYEELKEARLENTLDEIDAKFRDEIDKAEESGDFKRANDIRFRRYREKATAKGMDPEDVLSRSEWDVVRQRAEANRVRGNANEKAALDAAGLDDNNSPSKGKPIEYETPDGKRRPDSITNKKIIDVKSIEEGTVYFTEQLQTFEKAGRKGLPDGKVRDLAVVISGEEPLLASGEPKVRPSRPLAENADVLHRNSKTGKWMEWNPRARGGEGGWSAISDSQAAKILGGAP